MKTLLGALFLFAGSAWGQDLKASLRPELYQYKPWKADRDHVVELDAYAMGLRKLTLEERSAWEAIFDRLIKGVVADVLKRVEQQLAPLLNARAAPPNQAQAPAAKFVVVTNVSGKESIEKLTSDGSTIELLDGTVWRVNSADRFKASIWLESEEVLLINDEVMINVDQNGDYVHVRRVRD